MIHNNAFQYVWPLHSENLCPWNHRVQSLLASALWWYLLPRPPCCESPSSRWSSSLVILTQLLHCAVDGLWTLMTSSVVNILVHVFRGYVYLCLSGVFPKGRIGILHFARYSQFSKEVPLIYAPTSRKSTFQLPFLRLDIICTVLFEFYQ